MEQKHEENLLSKEDNRKPLGIWKILQHLDGAI